MALFFFLLTLLPFMELFLLIRIGRALGAPSVLAYLITMIFVGTWLAKNQGRRVLEAARASLAEGRVPEDSLLAGLLVLLGGVLLIIPGVISDLAGLLCLLPITRRGIAAQLQRALAARTNSVRVERVNVRWPPGGPRVPHGGVRASDVIDTVGEDVTEPKKPDALP